MRFYAPSGSERNGMTGNGILQIGLYFLVLVALTKPMGAYMAKVFAGERTWAHRFLRPVETAVYKLCGIELYIFIIPAGLTYTFGKMVRDTRQGWAIEVGQT
jgi:K+-transporting ATPase A subunit